MFFKVIILLCSVISVYGDARVAVANLVSLSATGSIYFTETDSGLRVQGKITGLKPGLYGFHVHELGDTSTCDATGAHFNPEGTTHGDRKHDVRHVGDLGNVLFVLNGTENIAVVDFVDELISLRGRNSILGRALVLHEQEDDLGLGGHNTSLTTGNAGARLACSTIGIYSGNWNSGISTHPSILLLVYGLFVIFFKY